MERGKYIVQIDNFYLNEFIFYWVYYNQPCKLILLKPKTIGLTGIKLIVDGSETDDFLSKAIEKIKCKIMKDNG
ncbi:hypothetical protein [uncultured Bacteroides sp.]|uniref:hypothetical protein n=1 Tax=uncultured Bacteroides sp. TaxID=162156 RepID=UPI002AA606B3|nr:hypothetical protein [uncultured Bacteroides sp.]